MPKDKAWNEVRVIGNYGGGGGSKRWQCKHCGEEKGGTATRIKDHLTSIPSKDIGPCLAAPQSVKDSFEPWRLFRLHQMQKKAQGSSSSSSSQHQHQHRHRHRQQQQQQQQQRLIEGVASSQIHPQPKRMRVEIATSDQNHDDDRSSDEEEDSDETGDEKEIVPGAGPTIPTPLVVIPLPPHREHGIATSDSFLRRSCLTSSTSSHKQQLVEKASIETARLFLRCGIPFDALRTPQWRSFARSISSLGFEWDGPSYGDVMREIRRDRAQIEGQFGRMKKETWSKYGCTIVCQGWSSHRSKRRIYSICASSCKGTVFLRAINASCPEATPLTGLQIWEHVHAAIMEVGKENVVQVVTNVEPNCIDMGLILEEEFPSISWTPCASHSIELLVEDLQRLPWIESIFERAKGIVSFVTKQPKMLSIFRAHCGLELLRPSSSAQPTYMLFVVQRLVRVQRDLMRAVESKEWGDWDEHALPDGVEFAKNVRDEPWFLEVLALVSSIKPIYTILCIAEMEGSTMGLLYEYMDRIDEALTKNMSLPLNRVQDIKSVLRKHWNRFRKPIHAAAHALHPLWRCSKQHASAELQEGLQEYFEKWARGDMQVLRRLEDELLLFRNESLSFSRATAKLRECQLQPVSWWDKYGFSAPTLRRLALRVLSQDCSSGPRGRNCSTWARFHTKKRNRLSTAQFERLLYCYCNLHLLDNYHASTVPMEVNVDSIDIDKANAIPTISKERADIYTMLYEHMAAPLNCRQSHTARDAITCLTSTSKSIKASSHDIRCIDESFQDEEENDGYDSDDDDGADDDSDASR